jgi:GT2 family glycosyltransferase
LIPGLGILDDYPGHPSPVISMRTVGVHGLSWTLNRNRRLARISIQPIRNRFTCPYGGISVYSSFGCKTAFSVVRYTGSSGEGGLNHKSIFIRVGAPNRNGLAPDGTLISIVIVNWNSGQLLQRCIQSLLSNAAGCQIVVVDNASTDSSLLFTKSIHASDLLILRNDRNTGFAAGNNLGWRRSAGDQILLLNPDTECLPESISCLAQTLAADSAVWAVGGHLLSPSGKSQPGFNVRAFPSTGNVAAEMLMVDGIWPVNRRHRAYCAADAGNAMDVDQPAGACLMVARTTLETVNGFDEAFSPAWFEDVDLCRRIRNSGGRIQYQPKARFLHHGGYSLRQMPRQDFLEIYHTNQIRYFKKHHGLQNASRVKRWIVAGLILRSALSIVVPPVPGAARSASAKTYWKAAQRIAGLREAQL